MDRSACHLWKLKLSCFGYKSLSVSAHTGRSFSFLTFFSAEPLLQSSVWWWNPWALTVSTNKPLSLENERWGEMMLMMLMFVATYLQVYGSCRGFQLPFLVTSTAGIPALMHIVCTACSLLLCVVVVWCCPRCCCQSLYCCLLRGSCSWMSVFRTMDSGSGLAVHHPGPRDTSVKQCPLTSLALVSFIRFFCPHPHSPSSFSALWWHQLPAAAE